MNVVEDKPTKINILEPKVKLLGIFVLDFIWINQIN